jgi:hypothetical protein
MIIGRLRLSLYVGKMTLYLSAGMSITCVGIGGSGLGEVLDLGQAEWRELSCLLPSRSVRFCLLVDALSSCEKQSSKGKSMRVCIPRYENKP